MKQVKFKYSFNLGYRTVLEAATAHSWAFGLSKSHKQAFRLIKIVFAFWFHKGLYAEVVNAQLTLRNHSKKRRIKRADERSS